MTRARAQVVADQWFVMSGKISSRDALRFDVTRARRRRLPFIKCLLLFFFSIHRSQCYTPIRVKKKNGRSPTLSIILCTSCNKQNSYTIRVKKNVGVSSTERDDAYHARTEMILYLFLLWCIDINRTQFANTSFVKNNIPICLGPSQTRRSDIEPVMSAYEEIL